MAGELVPHTLPDGRTLMVPSYLANLQPAVQPSARFAGGFTPKLVPVDPGSEWTSVIPDGAVAPSPKPPEVRLPTRDETLAEQRKATLPASTSDPSKLTKIPTAGAAQQAAPGAPGTISDSVKEVGAEIANRHGGPARPGGLQVSTVKQEVQPGVDLLPEQKWRYGLERRPDLGQEVDPNAEQPTWGTAEPVMRARKTVLERGAEKAGEQARSSFDLQEQTRLEQSNAQKAMLAQQSQILDHQIGTIADRRARIAALQQTASDRAQEANSIEPRTRAEVWGSKGNTGRAMAVLSAVLGGFAGNHNGWDMVDKSVQEAVDDDRSKWERAQRAGLNARNDFERAVQLYGDPEMAELDVRNRKLANMLAMTNQQINDRSLDATAKMRGQQLYQQTYDQYLQGVQQLHDLANGKVLKEEVTQTQRPATGGGKAPTKLDILKAEAQATEYEDKILHRPKGGAGHGNAEAAEINKEEAGLAPVKTLLSRYQDSDEIPGLTGRNVVSRATRGALDWVGGEGTGTKALDSQEERANRIIIDRARLAYKHAVTGAGGSDKEAAQIDEAFAGARTKEDLQAAVRASEETIARHRALMAGQPSDAEATEVAPGAREVE